MTKRVIVTGASRGIGRAVARELAARGSVVAAVGRDANALEETARAQPSRIHPVVCDIADPKQRTDLVENAVAAMSGLDGLVNAAGIVRYDAVPNVGEIALRAQLEVNFVAPFLIAQEVASLLLEQKRPGSMVNVSSTLAQRAAPSTVAYAASKAAIDAATRGFAIELARHGIRMNSVLLGVVDTEMIRAPRPRGDETQPTGASLDARIAREVEGLRKLTPLGRLGEAHEVARTILHVLDAEWMTGSCVVLDGGIAL